MSFGWHSTPSVPLVDALCDWCGATAKDVPVPRDRPNSIPAGWSSYPFSIPTYPGPRGLCPECSQATVEAITKVRTKRQKARKFSPRPQSLPLEGKQIDGR